MENDLKPARYSRIAQLLHWVIAALIVAQYSLAWTAEDLPLGMHKLALLARHKSVGMTVFMLALLRLLWRFTHPSPEMPAGMRPVERRLAQGAHLVFYFLLFTLPLTGWTMSSAKSYSVSWFGLFTWPNLVGPSDDTFIWLRDTHEYLGYALFGTAILHVLAAFKHHFWDKDDVLLRMLPWVGSRKRQGRQPDNAPL